MRPVLALLVLTCSCSSFTKPDAGPAMPVSLDLSVAGGPGWLQDAMGYEIFVRSFADSNGDGNGDLQGITDRLPYLSDLGVSLLWLTPIHPAGSYHGYDVTDYDQVNPDFGTLADFEGLIAEAHRRHIRVVLDLVANHTSNRHPWFVAAQQGGDAAGRYLFRGDDPGWQANGRHVWKPQGGTPVRYYFSIFSAALPDLNYRDPRTLPAMQDVVALWLSRGADGYRLDAARYLVESPDPQGATTEPAFSDTMETHKVWRAVRAALSQKSPEAALIGEVWTDLSTIAQYRGAGDELHGCFNFPLAGALLDGLQRDSPQPMRDTLRAMEQATVPVDFFAPFLSNHDQKRSATVLGGDADKIRLAATLLLAMPGVPFLYYGEEIGLTQSGDPGDRGQRAPMSWTDAMAQQADPGSLWSHYRRLIRLRGETPALREPTLRVLSPSDDRLLAFSRGQAHRVVLVYNPTATALAGVRLPLPTDYPLGPQRDLLTGAGLPAIDEKNRAGYALPSLPPRSALWIAPR